MIKILQLFLLLILYSIFSISVLSQPDINDVQVQFSFVNGKTAYRIGEPITIQISFTANKSGYKIQKINSSSTEQFTISPTDGVYNWRYNYDHLYNLEDVIIFKQLSDQPTNVTVTLNNFIRFDKAGKYSVNITTNRVYYSKTVSEYSDSYQKKLSPFTSKPLEFKILEMSEADEKAEIARLSALIETQKGNLINQNTAVENLSFLTGDVSTIEKVRRFLNSEKYQTNMSMGLLISRNKTLAFKLLEDALHDLNRDSQYSLINMLSLLRSSQEDEKIPPTTAENETEIWKFLEKRQKRIEEISQIYVNELFESLPNRTGKNKINTAITIFNLLPREDKTSEALITTKAIILNNFDDLDAEQQSNLLFSNWEKLKTPVLIPSLEKILLKKSIRQSADPRQYADRVTPLTRLVELDKKRVRPFILSEIVDPQSPLGIELLGNLDDKFLPEIDDAILSQIRELGQLKNGVKDEYLLRVKSLIAARYATSKIYNGLMEVYKNYGDKWSEEARISLLLYFVRHNEKEAIPLIEERISKSGKGGLSKISYYLTRLNFTSAIENIFRKYLQSDDLQEASNAANYLSKYGTKENKKLIENRYKTWLKVWKPRRQEFDTPKPDFEIQKTKYFQINLINSLLNAKSWKLTNKEIANLKETCLSENCQKSFPKEKLP